MHNKSSTQKDPPIWHTKRALNNDKCGCLTIAMCGVLAPHQTDSAVTEVWEASEVCELVGHTRDCIDPTQLLNCQLDSLSALSPPLPSRWQLNLTLWDSLSSLTLSSTHKTCIQWWRLLRILDVKDRCQSILAFTLTQVETAPLWASRTKKKSKWISLYLLWWGSHLSYIKINWVWKCQSLLGRVLTIVIDVH